MRGSRLLLAPPVDSPGNKQTDTHPRNNKPNADLSEKISNKPTDAHHHDDESDCARNHICGSAHGGESYAVP